MKLRLFPLILIPFLAAWGLLWIAGRHADKVDEKQNSLSLNVLAPPAAEFIDPLSVESKIELFHLTKLSNSYPDYEFLLVKKDINFRLTAWKEGWAATIYVTDGFRIYMRKRQDEAA